MRAWRKVNDLVIGFPARPGIRASRRLVAIVQRKAYRSLGSRGGAPRRRMGHAAHEGLDVWAPTRRRIFIPRIRTTWRLPGRASSRRRGSTRRTAAGGVLRALRAGTFFGVHGGIAERVEIGVTARVCREPAGAGEVLRVATGSSVVIDVRVAGPPEGLEWPTESHRSDRNHRHRRDRRESHRLGEPRRQAARRCRTP